ncbi:hypothetical protein ACFL6U_02750 [Planctomycetota bacterium]
MKITVDEQYTLEVHEEDALIEIKTHPTVTFSTLVASQADTERLAQEKGVRKVLVDAQQMQQTPSLPEFFSFGRGLLKSPVLRDLRYALLASPASGLQLQFLRSVTRNLGFAVNLFDNRDDAMQWLDEDEGK